MGRLKTTLFGLLLTTFISAQPTTFMGIPIDGTVDQIIKRLENKGFELNLKNSTADAYYLDGNFNNRQTAIIPISYKDKVWRICVISDPMSAELVTNTYSLYLEQFNNNDFYTTVFNLPSSEEVEKQVQNLHFGKSTKSVMFLQDGDPLRFVWMFIFREDFPYQDDYCIIMYFDNLNNAPKGNNQQLKN